MSPFMSKLNLVISPCLLLANFFIHLTEKVEKQQKELATRLIARVEEFERMKKELDYLKEKLEKGKSRETKSEMGEASFWDVTSI